MYEVVGWKNIEFKYIKPHHISVFIIRHINPGKYMIDNQHHNTKNRNFDIANNAN